jgi:hypothetical protein
VEGRGALTEPAAHGDGNVADEQADEQIGLAGAKLLDGEAGGGDQQANDNLVGIATRRSRWIGQHEQGQEQGGLNEGRA